MVFWKIFHIDNGRKYFTLDELKEIIRVLHRNNYNMMEISPANGGLRFLLNDMSVGNYSSDEVKNAIKQANRHFCNSRENELNEEEMTDFISYAEENNIGIMPLFDSPGHMEAIIEAMEILGISSARYHNSSDTIDLECQEAVCFTEKLLRKYAVWFSEHGCKYFNIGCDEYANDVLTSGFAHMCESASFKYDSFINYANRIAQIVIDNGMVPVMFNDGMYYDMHLDGGKLNKCIVCSYWTKGWKGYTPAPIEFIAAQGHEIILTLDKWYYVLGRRATGNNSLFCDEQALYGLKNYHNYNLIKNVIGIMFCLWTDEADAEYNDEEKMLLKKMIESFEPM